MYLITKHTLTKRTAIAVFMIVAYAIAIAAFQTYRDALVRFQPYYMYAHLYGTAYRLADATTLRAGDTNDPAGESAAGTASSVPVLLYHGILRTSDGSNVTIDTFWDQMKTLKDAGWRTITVEEFYDWKRGARSLPPRSFLLTFDDGRADSYYPADPILAALDYHAAMFAIAKYTFEEARGTYYLSESEIRRMAQNPRWEIQSHGVQAHEYYPIDERGAEGHFFGNKLWLARESRLETDAEFAARTMKDLEDSKAAFERALGMPVIGFAFPFGDVGNDSSNFPEAAQYVTAESETVYPLRFYQVSPTERFTQSYPAPEEEDAHFGVKRINVLPEWDGARLREILEAGAAKPLPFVATWEPRDGWIDTQWGTVMFGKDGMRLAAAGGRTGSAVILDGTRAWTDYVARAAVDWGSGNNIYLVARHKNDNNTVACHFGQDIVNIEVTVDGVSHFIKGEALPVDPREVKEVGVAVLGREIACLINGTTVVETPYLDERLDRGGVGVKIWDPVPDNARLRVKSFTVGPLQQES